MALSTGYLTPKQKQIWDLKKKGFVEANIAKRLDVTRQTVHKAISVANNKIAQALMEVARLNKIVTKTVNPTAGILLGYSPEFKAPAVITFSARNGVQIWYKREGGCKNCDQLQTCRKMLLTEMEDRGIQLFENLDSILPSELAELLFSKILGE